MRVKDNRGNVLLTLAVGTGRTIVGAGEILLTITDSQTGTMPVNCALPYDLQWTTAAGVKKTILAGNFFVTDDITP